MTASYCELISLPIPAISTPAFWHASVLTVVSQLAQPACSLLHALLASHSADKKRNIDAQAGHDKIRSRPIAGLAALPQLDVSSH